MDWVECSSEDTYVCDVTSRDLGGARNREVARER